MRVVTRVVTIFCIVIKKFVFSPILIQRGEITVLMRTAISLSFVKIGLKTKKFYHYAKFCRGPFLNCNYSSGCFTTFETITNFLLVSKWLKIQ